MEILQFLLNNFLSGKDKTGLSALKPIIELLQKHNFNLSKILSELNPEMLAPIVSAFTSAMENTKSPPQSGGQSHGVSPIAKLADKEIVYTLNKYFSD